MTFVLLGALAEGETGAAGALVAPQAKKIWAPLRNSLDALLKISWTSIFISKISIFERIISFKKNQIFAYNFQKQTGGGKNFKKRTFFVKITQKYLQV